MLSLIICSLATAHIDNGDIPAEMLPPAVGVKLFNPRRFRSLEQENFQKTSPNFFDFKPNCEQLGSRYCDYASHSLGSGQEFASWVERTQFVYTNMARMDFSKFAQAPYSASYACATKSGLTPFYWSSELTQASRFHSHEMATLNHWGHATAPQNADLFGGSVNTGDRIAHFMTSTMRGWGENIAAGNSEPLSVTKQWLESSGHCTQFFGTSSFLGVGYFYTSSSKYRHYWTQNFWTGPALPTQDIVAGTHDTTSNTNRFLVQVHMAQAPSTVLLVIGGTTKPMSLLLGTAKTGTYFVDVATLPAGDSDGCVPYHFKVNGASRMPADTSYYFLTYGFNNCKRNIGQGGSSGGNSQTPVGNNQCTCANGTPKTGAACSVNGASMCASCNSGFSMNSQQTGCTLKVCNCPNGSPKIGAACAVNGAAMCASCNIGFSLNSQQTGCTASGGALPTCKAVPLKSRGMCQTCFHQSQCIDGFYCCPFMRKCVSSSSMPCGLPIAHCRPVCFDNKCTLGQGCDGCDGCTGIAPHTWLEWANLADSGKVKTCTSAATTNKCNCANGTPKAGAACSVNGASMCASCNSGFSMNAQQTRCVNDDGVDTVTNIVSTVTENPDTSTEASDIVTQFDGPITNKSSATTEKAGDGVAVAVDVAVPRAGAVAGLCVPIFLQTLLYLC